MLFAIIALLAVGIPGGFALGLRAGKELRGSDPMSLFALLIASMIIPPVGIMEYAHLPFVQALFAIGWAFGLALVGSAAHKPAAIRRSIRR